MQMDDMLLNPDDQYDDEFEDDDIQVAGVFKSQENSSPEVNDRQDVVESRESLNFDEWR